MTRFLLILTLCLLPCHVQAQDTPPPKSTAVEQLNTNPFRRELLKAITEAARKREITPAQALRLRVASFSPAFLKTAEDVAKTQMAFSGEEVPVDDEGKIEVRDWSAFFDFLVKLLPILLELIKGFTMLGHDLETSYAMAMEAIYNASV
jgi:hypothetical protein